MHVSRVKNESVWQSLRILYIGAPLIFLINIFFGFDNALTVGEIPRWQVLIHLHGGSIGWITLSAIGFAIWMLTGDRDVTEAYEKRVKTLVWAAVIVFAGYVPTFGLAFSRPSGFLVTLLPIFGASAVIVLWASAIFSLAQLRQQSVLTTVHILAAGALLVAAIGATVGMLLGLERAIGQFLPLGEDRVGAHAGMMDTYLFLVASAIVEWLTRKEPNKRWTIAGLIQGVAWTIGAALVPIAFFINAIEQILPLFGLMLLVGLVIFLARSAWGALKMGPMAKIPQAWAFFGTVWLILFMAGFLYAVGSGDFENLPFWFPAIFAHSAFVGMMTNLIFGVISVRAREASHVVSWGEKGALWAINLGMILFFILKIAADIRWPAMFMGAGVLLGVFTMVQRLRASAAPA